MNQTSILKWCFLSGITHCIGDIPVNRFKIESKEDTNKLKTNEKINNPTSADIPFLEQALSAATAAQNLDELDQAIVNFEGCSLKKTAEHTFTGFGKKENPLVFCLTDAPKSADEKDGILASGDRGVLLKKMLKAINLDCESNTYLCPLIPWRLPGDRIPTDTEVQLCTPFIKKRIELINPDFILILGAIPVRALLNIDSITKARQQNLSYNASKNIPVIATFGPEMVMKGQSYRKSAWTDLQKLAQLIQNK